LHGIDNSKRIAAKSSAISSTPEPIPRSGFDTGFATLGCDGQRAKQSTGSAGNSSKTRCAA
jgi:hypothetical protein